MDRQRAEGQQLLLAAWLARSIGSWHSKLQCRAELACWAASSCMAFSRKTAAYESSWFARANSCLLSPACSPGCSACAQCHACASCTAALVCTEPFKPPALPPEQAPLLPAWSVSSGCCPAIAVSPCRQPADGGGGHCSVEECCVLVAGNSGHLDCCAEELLLPPSKIGGVTGEGLPRAAAAAAAAGLLKQHVCMYASSTARLR